MNQTLDIASRIYCSLIAARPGGNRTTQAIDALYAATELLEEAQKTGIDITDAVPTPKTTEFTIAPIPQALPGDKPLSFGAKRKS
jgi:hypothetical protein